MLNINYKISSLLFAYTTCLFFSYQIKAQTNNLSEKLSPYLHPIELVDGQLSGPGFEWLKTQAASCDFINFGEGHGIEQVPQIVGGVYQALYPDGFHYLAVENGPYVGKIVSEQTMAGEKRAAKKLMMRHANAIAFSYNDNVRLMEEVASRFAKDHQAGQAVWGLDQAFGASHLFERLIDLAPDKTTKKTIQTYAKKSKKRAYLLDTDRSTEYEALRKLFPKDATEAQNIIDNLYFTNRIYYNWMQAWRVKKDGMGAFINGKEREEWMKKQFLEQYYAAQALGVKRPKVISYLGGSHTDKRGSYGYFVKDFALSQNTQALNVSMINYNEKWYKKGRKKPVYASLLEEGKILLLDSRSLKESALFQGEEIPESLKEDLLTSDALLFIPNAKSASKSNIILAKIKNVF